MPLISVLGPGQEKLFQLAHGPVPDLGVLRLVRGLPDQVLQVVHEQGALVQVANVRVGQESAGIRPRRLVRGGHPDRLIPLLEVVSGADQLPIERLIEAALDPANIREDVLARLDLRHRDGAPAGRGLGRNTIASKGGTGGSRHHEESSPGHLLPPCDSRL